MADQSPSAQPEGHRRGLHTRALISYLVQHDCASNNSHSMRALMVSPYPVALTVSFDGKSKPAGGSR